MNIVELLMNKKAIGEFKIIESPVDSWVGTVINVSELRGDKGFRVISVTDKKLNHYVNKPLPMVGAVTSSEFVRINGGI